MLTTELEILKKIDHPHLISLCDLYESKHEVYIVTDLARGGELFSQLLLKGSYTERDAANLVRQILDGLAYLHDHEVLFKIINYIHPKTPFLTTIYAIYTIYHIHYIPYVTHIRIYVYP